MSSVQHRSSLDGLPKQFISSLKVLFDILDESKTGFVKYSEIETRWKEDGVKGLPPGILGALQKVTPQNGLLSFERFVAGLKIAMLRNKGERNAKSNEKENLEPSRNHAYQQISNNNLKSNFNQNGVSQQPKTFSNQRTNRSATTATVRPHNIGPPPQRSDSVPHLTRVEVSSENPPLHPQQQRSNMLRPNSQSHARLMSESAASNQKHEISNRLKSWQRDRITSAPGGGGGRVPEENQRNATMNKDLDAKLQPSRKIDPNHMQQGPLQYKSTSHIPNPSVKFSDEVNEAALYRKAEPRKGREPRRHTLGSGVDYNMIKRMKQLEQEKDLLLQGLELVEKTRDWYHKQIANASERQKFIGKGGPMDSSLEKNQERITFQAARITEANQRLKALIESSEKGIPAHMNLAVRQHPMQHPQSNTDTDNTQATNMLKAQNRMLTKEVSQKSERISQLEREKTTLVRQLFEVRSKQDPKHNYDDTTFM